MKQGTIAVVAAVLLVAGCAPTTTPGRPVPRIEVCNGIDDDQDGLTDEDTGGGACQTGLFGVCALGAEACENGRLLCVPDQEASIEICDGEDNDCNGQPDENLIQTCDTGQPGICAEGRQTCEGGKWGSCTPVKLPMPETCDDNLDNDCDALIDGHDPDCGPPQCGERVEGALYSDDAWNHISEYAAVEFCVGRTYNSGRAVFLDSCADYKGHFYVPVFPEYWDCWSEAPETYFYERCVVVQGEIQVYEGSPEIILRSCDLIRDLGPCTPATDSCK